MINSDSPQEVWSKDIKETTAPAADWLWHGFVARGNTTLLTGMWKFAGKTTLVSLLLARRKQGGVLAGLNVRPGKTLVVTEESTLLWAERDRLLDFGDNVCFLSRPFLTFPDAAQWQAFINRALYLRDQHSIDLVVIDPLAPLLRCENSAKCVLDVLLPLNALAAQGMAVLATHHPARGPRPAGEAARGSGAILGHVDISIEMRHPGGDFLTRRRRFLALSRHAETPRSLLLELNAEGTDYVSLVDDAVEDGFQANWHALNMVLEDADKKLTRLDILNDWPPDVDKPHPGTLFRWLTRAFDRGLLARDGKGCKKDPFRYWLAQREAIWKQNPLYQIFEQQRRDKELIEKLSQPWKGVG
jgi:hypothetical protein